MNAGASRRGSDGGPEPGEQFEAEGQTPLSYKYMWICSPALKYTLSFGGRCDTKHDPEQRAGLIAAAHMCTCVRIIYSTTATYDYISHDLQDDNALITNPPQWSSKAAERIVLESDDTQNVLAIQSKLYLDMNMRLAEYGTCTCVIFRFCARCVEASV